MTPTTKKIIYTYCIVRYVHDTAADEVMNVGVLVYAPSVKYFGLRLEQRYARLSEAFSGFDGVLYRRALDQLDNSLSKIWRDLSTDSLGLFELPKDVYGLASKVWQDSELCLRLGPTLAGVTNNLEDTLEDIFYRMVTSQYKRPQHEHRSDEDIWAKFSSSMSRDVKQILQEKVLHTEDFELKFDHAFMNGRWHFLQPVTFDYSRTESIQEKAARWLGRGTLLRDSPEVAKIYLLLGSPSSVENGSVYNKAKNILHRLPVNKILVEEHEAEDFARSLRDDMIRYGLLIEEDQNSSINESPLALLK